MLFVIETMGLQCMYSLPLLSSSSLLLREGYTYMQAIIETILKHMHGVSWNTEFSDSMFCFTLCYCTCMYLSSQINPA